jgi:putative two-component system response regulator
MEAVKEHSLVGAAIVEPLLGPDVAEIVLRHHEHYDGKGYPSRVAGARIPIGARIVAIADVWAAMTNPWTYAAAVPEQEAIVRLREGAGTQFDPVLVESFVSSLGAIV